MPFIRSLVSKRYTLLAIFISLNREIISPYSYCVKKGLVYIIIISLFSCQSSFYLECTKANTYLLCNVPFIPFNKYIFFNRRVYLCVYYNLLVPWLSYCRVLGLFYC